MTSIPLGPLNKSRSGSGIRQFSDTDSEVGEWKTSKIKAVNFENQVKHRVSNTKTFDEMLVPRRSRSSAPEADSQNQITEAEHNPFVTDGAAIEEKKEESNSSNDGLPPNVDKNDFLAMAPLLTQSPRNKQLGAQLSGRKIQKTPSSGHSSNSDMRELKLALGSDRSNGGNHFVFNPNENLYEHNGVIFSDEGSDDSFAREIEEDVAAGDAIWA